MIVENHYSKKWNNAGFGKYNFGIFKQDDLDNCLGVASYGYMKNLKADIFRHPNKDAWMIELNRMWISDELTHNSESILIGNSLRLLKKMDKNIVAVQSFADGRLGCGTIYKASNFKYYGFHYTIFVRNKRTQEVVHQQILTNTTSPRGYMRNNLAYLSGETEEFKVKTHRYIYPFCKKVVFHKFKEVPYPEYSKGEEKVCWARDKVKIKERLCSMIKALPE